MQIKTINKLTTSANNLNQICKLPLKKTKTKPKKKNPTPNIQSIITHDLIKPNASFSLLGGLRPFRQVEL